MAIGCGRTDRVEIKAAPAGHQRAANNPEPESWDGMLVPFVVAQLSQARAVLYKRIAKW
jgi:hypothetical protein